MDYFRYEDNKLLCEAVAVEEIAAAVGTPVYIYSAATLREHYRRMAQAFAELEPLICFSVKSLANVHLLRLLAEEGCGFDVVSGGELYRVRQAGGDPAKVAFAGVGKTDREMDEAIAAGIAFFNVESEQEFESLSRRAAAGGRVVRAALRINPDVYDPRTHRYTATGRKQTKFGVDIDRAEGFFADYGRDAHARLEAIHFHLGSPIYSPQPYVEAIEKSLALIQRLREQGFEITALNIGGGYAADYEEDRSPVAAKYAAAIVPLLRGQGLRMILEPGRQIACNAGLLLARVLYVKQGGGKRFVIVDAAMTDLIRPSVYGAEHFMYPAALGQHAPAPRRRIDFAPPGAVQVDVVGGVCESTDFLAQNRLLPPLVRGDLLAIFSAGAYGFVMSSQYNARPRAAEVLVEGEHWRIIRRRETYEDLLGPEREV